MGLGFEVMCSPLHAAPALDLCLLPARHPVLVSFIPITSPPLPWQVPSKPTAMSNQHSQMLDESNVSSLSDPIRAAISTNHCLMWEGARNSPVITMFACK